MVLLVHSLSNTSLTTFLVTGIWGALLTANNTILSVQDTNHSGVSAIFFLSSEMEKQPSVEEWLFMPRGILTICHPRVTESLFIHKDICTALQQFIHTLIPACRSDITVNDKMWMIYQHYKGGFEAFQMNLQMPKCTFVSALICGVSNCVSSFTLQIVIKPYWKQDTLTSQLPVIQKMTFPIVDEQ